MEKQKDNPKFSFLFGGDFYSYYKCKLALEQQQRESPQALGRHGGQRGPRRSQLLWSRMLFPLQNRAAVPSAIPAALYQDRLLCRVSYGDCHRFSIWALGGAGWATVPELSLQRQLRICRRWELQTVQPLLQAETVALCISDI